MRTRNPKVSVVMPVYNRSNLVNNAIHSICDQTMQDWELLVIDDGSDDREIEFHVKQFKDPRIKYHRIEHSGVVVARNFGSASASAPLIMMQDSDDLSLPDRMEKLYKFLKENKADAVYSSLYVNVWSAEKECISRLYVRAEDRPVLKGLMKEQYIPGIPMYKKSIWKKKPFRMETQYAYDWMMWIDWLMENYKICGLDEGLYEYVRQEDSVSIQFEKDGRRKASLLAMKKIIKDEYGETFKPVF